MRAIDEHIVPRYGMETGPAMGRRAQTVAPAETRRLFVCLDERQSLSRILRVSFEVGFETRRLYPK